ncbi:MAG: hemolysin III family protein [Acidimicrobiia bacterium]|nr:hemolysin III family protein [Acidimicrobiia bacterium]
MARSASPASEAGRDPGRGPEAPHPPGFALPSPAEVVPRLRGVFHQWGAVVFGVIGLALVVVAPKAQMRVALAVYAVGLTGMLTISALYHRGPWTPRAKRIWQKLDHSGIFLAIAGTYTPLSAAVGGWLGPSLLVTVWVAAAAGIAFEWLPIRRPAWYGVVVYIALGWLAVVALPRFWTLLGLPGFSLVVVGGVLYTLGAIVLATHWPNPSPRVFGYHEVWHVFTLVAALAQFVAIASTVALRG